MISIIILYCDKDKHFLNDLLLNIKDNVKISKEVILIDNTTDGYKPEENYDVYFSMGGNKYQVQGRKKGIELAKGEYTWFVDVDDLINKEITEFNYCEDIICFNAVDSATNKLATLVKENNVYNSHSEVFNLTNYLQCNVMLWNKWIKTSILKEIENFIPGDIMAICSEDKMVFVLSFWKAESLRFITDSLYINRSTNGYSNNTYLTLDMFNHLIFGFDKTENIIHSVIPKDDLAIIGELNQVSNAKYFLNRICYADSLDLIPQMAKILEKHISKKDIINAWCSDYEHYYAISPEHYAQLEKIYGPFTIELDAIVQGKPVKIKYAVSMQNNCMSYSPLNG